MKIKGIEKPNVGTVLQTRRGSVTTVEGDAKVILEDDSFIVPADERERTYCGYAYANGRDVRSYGVDLG